MALCIAIRKQNTEPSLDECTKHNEYLSMDMTLRNISVSCFVAIPELGKKRNKFEICKVASLIKFEVT